MFLGCFSSLVLVCWPLFGFVLVHGSNFLCRHVFVLELQILYSSAVGSSSICWAAVLYKLLPVFVSSGTSQYKTLLCAFEAIEGHVWCSHHDNDPYCYGVHHIQLLVAWILAQHPGVSVSTGCIQLTLYSFHKIVLKKHFIFTLNFRHFLCYFFNVTTLKGRDHLGSLDVGRKIMLKWTF